MGARLTVSLDDLVVTLPAVKAFNPGDHPRHPAGTPQGGEFMAVDAVTILGTQVGPQGGSNPGGVWRGTDGVERYVKFYSDPVQAHGEHLANQLYADLGLGALQSQVFTHKGRTSYASRMLAGAWKQLGSGMTPQAARQVLQGYVADVFTANWDAVGLVHDNVLLGPAGQALRVDNGGAFLMRAKAGRKPEGLLDEITEWEGFANPKINPSYARVFAMAKTTPAQLVPQARAQVAALGDLAARSGGWLAYVQTHTAGLAAKEQRRMAQMLTARHAKLRALVGAP